MDVRRSRSLHSLASVAQTVGLLLSCLCLALGWWAAGLSVIVLVGAVTVVRMRIPVVAAPDPELSDGSIAALRAEREGISETSAIRTLRAIHPELSLVQAVRVIRTI